MAATYQAIQAWLEAQFGKFATAVKNWANGKFAPKASPEFTGVPTAPKAEKGTNTTQIATTSFVKEAVDAAVLEGVGSIDLTSFFDDVAYDSESKNIQFKNGGEVKKTLSAAPFIKDGMVNTVSITDGKTDGANNGKKVLLITFNTDSGKEDIEIPLDGIFDASNYLTKEQVNTELGKKLDKTTYEEDKATFETKENAGKTYVKEADWQTKTADFLTDDDLDGYIKNEDLVDIDDSKFAAMFAEA